LQTFLFTLAGFKVQPITNGDTTLTIAAQALSPTSACLSMLPPIFSHRAMHDLKQMFSVRRLIRLVLSHSENLNKEQTQEITHTGLLHPEVATVWTLAQAFVKMLRGRNVDALSPWLTQAQASPTPGAAQVRERRIERDRAVVEASLHREESNSQTEGQITKLKFIKRSMYGRGSFALHRKRVLNAAWGLRKEWNSRSRKMKALADFWRCGINR
jgi:hypothetical protein